MENQLLHVSSGPHIRDKGTTGTIMRDVALALLPATVFGVWNFGLHALLLVIVTIATCVATEALYQHFTHQSITVFDGTALVTGLLLALNLPPTLPIGIAVLGGVFAILVVKQAFGGVGYNIMNPALGARCFLLISFAGRMTAFTKVDAVTGATPLAVLKNGGSVSLMDMFVGTIGGTIGETSVIALLIGAVYLLAKKVIDPRIPFSYIITFSIFVLLFGGHGFDLAYLTAHLCGGGLMLGAFYMATDYVTSPITAKGRILFGVVLGILTGIFRLFGASAEGVSYAIIFGNLLVPLIEKITVPKAFGREGKQA
ncbi:MAG: RnfABCDGE type electron transport complex subunit D [Lachnospiraceae bacterium]